MAVVTLMLFSSLIYTLYMTEDINLMQFLLLTFFIGSKSYPSSMDIIGLRVPTRNLRDFPMFHVSPSFRNCPSSSHATAANSVCSGFDIFRRQSITLSQVGIIVSVIGHVTVDSAH
jgi:hypothetical protein